MFAIKALAHELLEVLRARILMAIMDAEDKKLQKELEKEFPPSDDIPEGPVITVDPNDFRVPKVLMNPSLIGLDQKGIQHLLTRAIQACDPLLQPGLWNNVTLTGPFARVETLQSELSSLASEGMPVRVRIA